MAKDSRSSVTKLILLGLHWSSQVAHGPVCHYLFHTSPNLDGNGLSLYHREVKGTWGSHSIFSLASSPSWRSGIALFPKLENFCVIRRSITVTRWKAQPSGNLCMSSLLSVALQFMYTVYCVIPEISLSISPVVLGLLGAWALGQELVVSDPHFQNVLLFIIGSDTGIIFRVLPAPFPFTHQKVFSTCVSITSWFLFLRDFLQ